MRKQFIEVCPKCGAENTWEVKPPSLGVSDGRSSYHLQGLSRADPGSRYRLSGCECAEKALAAEKAARATAHAEKLREAKRAAEINAAKIKTLPVAPPNTVVRDGSLITTGSETKTVGEILSRRQYDGNGMPMELHPRIDGDSVRFFILEGGVVESLFTRKIN